MPLTKGVPWSVEGACNLPTKSRKLGRPPVPVLSKVEGLLADGYEEACPELRRGDSLATRLVRDINTGGSRPPVLLADGHEKACPEVSQGDS